MAKKLPKIIDKKDVLSILSKINRKCPTGCRNFAILVTLYRAGLRVSEACDLTVPDMNFKTGQIYVQNGKGGKDRYVPMDVDIISACKAWGEMKELGGIKSEYFFCTLGGGRVDPRYLREVCRRLSEKAGVFIQDGKEKKSVSPHKLRHTYATELIREGHPLRYVQELLGHSSPATTQVYTHVTTNDLTKIISGREPMAPVN